MQQINKILKSQLIRSFSSNSKPIIEPLKTRSLIRVSGNDAATLLQGLITNDMEHLNEIKMGSMYAMFLNNKGRVLYDTIVYKIPENNTYYLEVDEKVIDVVKKHLNFYRLRKKVEIQSINDQYRIWVCLKPTQNILETNLLNFNDPRVSELGIRIIAPTDTKFPISNSETYSEYKRLRYQLGVGEGIEELPLGNSFPLEANCDYLHGVSFQKGCYIGQELTARTFHTGVIRKRLMPLRFETEFQHEHESKTDEIVKNKEDMNVGKLRGVQRDYGLGLLRIEQALKSKNLVVNNVLAHTKEPDWWPKKTSMW